MLLAIRGLPFSKKVLISLFALVVLCVALLRVPSIHRSAELFSCRYLSAESARTECVFAVIEHELKETTTGDAMKVLTRALPILPHSDTSCHIYSHRVGDIAYYQLYVFNPNSVTFTYPVESIACDYGFYHGFYEHYFQEHPGLSSIIETCSALPNGPEPYRRVIRQTCFHGAGHGLVLAQIDTLTSRDWGNIHAFTDAPLAACSHLKSLKPDEFARCPLGVFAVIAQSRLLKDYGFSFAGPASERFKDCLTFAPAYRNACIFTNSIVAELSFGVDGTFASCEVLESKDAAVSCVQGIILGLFVHGADEKRVKSGLSFCASAGVAARDATHDCYLMLEWSLYAYFPEEQHQQLCALFPSHYSDRRCLVIQGEILPGGL